MWYIAFLNQVAAIFYEYTSIITLRFFAYQNARSMHVAFVKYKNLVFILSENL